MISRRTVLCLGISQFVCWGVSFYLVGVFGDLMVADLGWRRAVVYGGFSAALLVMGFASPLVGRLIDRFGGAPVMAAGSVLCAAGCVGIAVTQTVFSYYVAWACVGLAMRATLYEAAFAALARLGGPAARRPMALVTLFGGVSSSFFWPVGHALADCLGWRGALVVYGGLALLTVPLHLALGRGRYAATAPGSPESPPPPRLTGRRNRAVAAILYSLIITLTSVLSSAMSAHMIGLLTELGLAAALAVGTASLRGIGQSSARLCEVLFGARIDPVDLTLLALVVLPLSFVVGLAGAGHMFAAAAFAFFYGAANGMVTITGGTMPLVLFDLDTYGAFVGKLLVPSFVISAMAPIAFAAVLERFGASGVLWLSIALSAVTLAAVLALKTLVSEGCRTR